MSNLIQIKRSLNTAVPASLANGEFAYTANGDVLFIGSNGQVIPVGGARTPGLLTANQSLVANSSSWLNAVQTAKLIVGAAGATINIAQINTISNSTVLGAAANNELVTSWAAKNYVDLKIAAAGASVAGTNTQIQFNDSGVLAGSAGFTFDKTANNLTIANSIIVAVMNSGNSTVNSTANSTMDSFSTASASMNLSALGVVTGIVTINATAVSVGANAILSSGVLTLGNSTVNSVSNSIQTTWGGASGPIANQTTFAVGSMIHGTSSFAAGANNTFDLTGVRLGNTTVNSLSNSIIFSISNATASANLSPTGLVAGITVANSLQVSIGANAILSAAGLSVGNSTVNSVVNSTSIKIGSASLVTNLLTVSDATGAGNLTFGNINATANVNALKINATDLVLTGNLTVSGTMTTVDATNLQVKDSMIKLADQNLTTDLLDVGFYGAFGNSTVTQYTGLYRPAGGSTFKLFTGAIPEPTGTVNSANVNYSSATLQAFLASGGPALTAFIANNTVVNITANSTVSSAIAANTLSLSTPLPVSSGGIGVGSITNQSILVGNSTGGLAQLAAGSDGTLLQVSGTTLVYNSLDGGTF